jgi:hypothetical protein
LELDSGAFIEGFEDETSGTWVQSERATGKIEGPESKC